MAKAMGGGGGSYSQSTSKHVPVAKSKPGGPKKLSHKELLMKWTRDGGKFGPPRKVWTKADIDRARNSKNAADDDANRVDRPDAGVAGEDEEETGHTYKASQIAHVRMAELAEEMQTKAMQALDDVSESQADGLESYADASPEELQTLADCYRSKLDELEMIEAMFVDEFCPLYDSAGVEELRTSLEADGAEALRSVAAHPRFEFLLQMTVPDQRTPDETNGKQLVASILLHVAFPPMYPTPDTPPELRIEDIMITDALEEMSLDKVLWPVVHLDMEKLIAEMSQRAAECLPGPCVYEAVTWMSENTYSFAL